MERDRREDICHVVIINGKDLIAYLQPQYVLYLSCCSSFSSGFTLFLLRFAPASTFAHCQL